MEWVDFILYKTLYIIFSNTALLTNCDHTLDLFVRIEQSQRTECTTIEQLSCLTSRVVIN